MMSNSKKAVILAETDMSSLGNLDEKERKKLSDIIASCCTCKMILKDTHIEKGITMSYKGKAIYNPHGKAGEYSNWACNFYVGCSNKCTYCYLKKGIGKSVLGGDIPTLKRCFNDEDHALEVFKKELIQNIGELQKHGLFFSFTTDPMLPETIDLTIEACNICVNNNIPVQILTKVDFTTCDGKVGVNQLAFPFFIKREFRPLIAFGFTLTGHDELELNASTNLDRTKVMGKLHHAGFKTFASIEPIVDFLSAKSVIKATLDCCDLYKIGLMSGKKYDQAEAKNFVKWLSEIPEEPKIYLKESLQKLIRYRDITEKLGDNFVGRDYNLFQ